MIVNKKEHSRLYQEWTESRYFPETSFFDFLQKKGIRVVDSNKIKKNIEKINSFQRTEKAGVLFYDLLQDIIEGKERDPSFTIEGLGEIFK